MVVFALSLSVHAQSLATGVQYLGAAASQTSAKNKRAVANGEKPSVTVDFQMNVEVSGRARWGAIPSTFLGTIGSRSYNINNGNTLSGGPGANIDLGLRFNDAYFIGVGAMFCSNFGDLRVNEKDAMGNDYTIHAVDMYLPIYGVFKVYIPSSSGVDPYFDLGIGGYLPDWYVLKSDFISEYGSKIEFNNKFKDLSVEGERVSFGVSKGGLYFHAAVGVDINSFNISTGYELTTDNDGGSTRLYHNIFAKVGFRIGG